MKDIFHDSLNNYKKIFNSNIFKGVTNHLKKLYNLNRFKIKKLP
jgi:hypothetical protein